MHFTSRTVVATLFTASLAGLAVPAGAAGLGVPELRSHLGEPLRLVVPLRIAAGEGFSDDCVRVVPSREADGVPPVYGARARVVRGSERNEVVVTTSEPMQEPIIRVVVEVGCTASVSRDFVMLLDPPVNAGSVLPGAVEGNDPALRPAPVSPAPRRAAPSRSVTADSGEAAPAPRPRAPRAAAPTAAAPTVAAVPSAPSTAVPAAPSAGVRTPSVPAPASSTPRLRLEDPVALAGAQRPPDTTTAVTAPSAATSVPPAVPQPTTQEVELINKLTALGEQIDLLKRQVAEQSALNAQLREQQQQAVPLTWFYILVAIAIIAALIALRMAYQMRRMRQAVPTHAWWAETRLRSDPATIMKAGAAQPPAPQGPPTLMPGTGPVVSQADAEQEVFYPNGARTDPAVRLDARFARQDSRIEVEELGATQAMKVLGETNVQMAITQNFDSAVRASAAASQPPDAPAAIHSLDFDLGEPVLTTPGASRPPADAPGAGIPSVDFPIDDPAPVAPLLNESSQFIPEAAGPGNSGPMSWIEARQVQTYLRQTADAIEQADAYLSAGQSESAASVLRRLIQDKEGTPRAPWLMLMHIYRRTDKREAYDGLAAKFATQFGRTPPPWDLVSANPTEPGLDSDPQLLQAIWAKWGSADSMTLLSQLLYDREAGDEAFFNLTLQRDLLNFVKICPLEES